MPAPVVAIIGRPNVGKSTFFNRVLGERRAVVHDRPGITRDRNAVRTEWAGRPLVLVDTGGFVPTAASGRDALVRKQAEAAIGVADLVLFMVDATTGATDLDQAIARALRRRGQAHLLVVNKVDKPGDLIVHDFHRFGIETPIPISAENGFGIGDLLDEVMKRVPMGSTADEPSHGRIAIVGRPNVGKSSIVNALLGEERMIVEPTAGTTLDPVDSTWRTPAGTFVLVDTAGIRKQSHYGDPSEFYATVRALHALERADIACLVVDTPEGFRGQEARLAHNALDAGCSLLVVYNKWDLIEQREQAWKDLIDARQRRYPTLGDLPALPLSATSGLHLAKLPGALAKRVEEHGRRIPTAQINRWLENVQQRRAVPANRLGRIPKIYYATQSGTRPPELTVFANAPQRLSEAYRRFLWLDFTDTFDFHGTPVRLKVRKSD